MSTPERISLFVVGLLCGFALFSIHESGKSRTRNTTTFAERINAACPEGYIFYDIEDWYDDFQSQGEVAIVACSKVYGDGDKYVSVAVQR